MFSPRVRTTKRMRTTRRRKTRARTRTITWTRASSRNWSYEVELQICFEMQALLFQAIRV